MLPGGLWDTSHEVYSGLGTSRIGYLDWVFPPFGNRIVFHHLQHSKNVNDWQGSQVTYFGWDELPHFLESMFTYVSFSRGRSGCEVPSYVRITCNPDPGWVKTTYFAPWVDRAFPGTKARPGEIRHFVRSENGKLDWVPATTPDCISVSFFPAKVTDNPTLLRNNPGYIGKLKALSPIERARLLDGDWDVRREGLVYEDFQRCIVEESPLVQSGQNCGGIDFGFHNPFAAPWGYLDHDDVLWITGLRYQAGCTLPLHAANLPKDHRRWWADPAEPGLIRELRLGGHDVIPCVHVPGKGASGEKRNPKLAGIDKVTERMRTGRLKIVRGECLDLIRELSMYCYDPEKQSEEPLDINNHACDALRYLIVGLDRGKSVRSSHDPAQDAVDEQQEKDREQGQRELREQARQENPMDPSWWEDSGPDQDE
jgi:hypothetical protein